MAIDHELSSEIAAALLTGKERAPGELNHLKETVFRVHSTLQQLTAESRRNRIIFRAADDEDKDKH
jgi:hypothetical protein